MAIDNIARGLAASMLGSDGKIASDKMPIVGEAPTGAQFYPLGALKDSSLIEGKTAEEILLMMLFGVVNPTLTKPSFSAKLTTLEPYYAGRSQTLQGTLTFNRGKISPAYGTSGYRAGAPTKYFVNGIEIASTALSTSFNIEVTPTEGQNVISCKVEYGIGDQPLNSAGAAYDQSYPAGSLTFDLKYEAMYPVYSADGKEIEIVSFTDGTESGYQVVFESEGSTGKRQSFAIPTTSTVIGIKQYDVITKDWAWIGGDAESSLETFDTTIVTGDSFGEAIEYTVYTHNGAQSGERQLRIYLAK